MKSVHGRKSIFRYRSLGNLSSDTLNFEKKAMQEFSAIENSYLWFSDFDSLNDPSEISDAEIIKPQNGFQESINSILGGHGEEVVRVMNARAQYYSKGLLNKESSGVCCFSKTPEHQALWAYYANDYKGICIEYDLEKLLSLQSFCWGNKLHKVAYQSDRKIYAEKTISLDHEVGLIALCTKNPDWAHEQEARLFSRNKVGKHYHSKDALVSITLGLRTPKLFKDEVLRIAKLNNKAVFELKMNSYNLIRNKILDCSLDASKNDFSISDLCIRTKIALISSHQLSEASVNHAIELASKVPNLIALGGLIFTEKSQILLVILSVMLGDKSEGTKMLKFPVKKGIVCPNYTYVL